MKQKLMMLLGLILLVSCSTSAVPPQPVENNDQAIMLVSDAIRFDQTETVSIVAPIWIEGSQAQLVNQLSIIETPMVVVNPQVKVIELNQVPELASLMSSGGNQYGIVRATGVLSPTKSKPVLEVQDIKVLEPVQVNFDDLFANLETYDDQVITIAGSLLLTPQEALFVQELTPGGVPTESAKQLKILQPFDDPNLRVIGNAEVGVAAVQITGILQGKSIRVFWVEGM